MAEQQDTQPGCGEMVERVARAIYDTCPIGVRSYEDAPASTRKDCRVCARVAIGALRDPNETMSTAGGDYLGGNYLAAEGAWRRMIAAALLVPPTVPVGPAERSNTDPSPNPDAPQKDQP